MGVGAEWQRFDYPLKISKPFGAGAAGLFLGFGFNEQTIEIGGVQLLRFGKDVQLRDLPRTPVKVPGSEPDAPWRTEAAARIEKHRKADLEVKVVDARGNPVPGANVTVAMVDWLKTAREVLPDTPLFINEFGILDTVPGHANQETYKKTIRFLLDRGAPVDGIGLQSHIGGSLPHPGNVVKILNDFAQFGLAMRITEFDVNIGDEDAQARFTRDFMIAVFSHPGVVGFQMWGFWEGRHWRPNGAMVRKNWEEKPNALAYRDLLFKQWWTHAAGETNAAGVFNTRGFLGDYDLTATHAGKTKTVKTKLTRDMAPVTIVLK